MASFFESTSFVDAIRNAISLGGVVGELLGDNGDSIDEGSGEGDDPAVSTGKICTLSTSG